MTVHHAAFEIERPDGLVIRGDASLPEDAAAGVVFCHGFKGFGRWGFFPWLAKQLAARGLNVVSFDFSGSGVGADRENFTEADAFANNTFSRELSDLELVEREAQQRGWIGERFGLFGFSRGGGVAILSASRDPRVAALVSWSAIGTVARWPADTRRAWRARGSMDVPNSRTGQILQLNSTLLDDVERFGPTTLDIRGASERIQAPWLVVHGLKDETVPYGEAEDIIARAPAATTQLLMIEGAGHTYGATHPFVAAPPALEQATSATVEFFVEHLIGTAASA